MERLRDGDILKQNSREMVSRVNCQKCVTHLVQKRIATNGLSIHQATAFLAHRLSYPQSIRYTQQDEDILSEANSEYNNRIAMCSMNKMEYARTIGKAMANPQLL